MRQSFHAAPPGTKPRTVQITAPKLVKKLIDLQEVDITLPNGHTQTAYPDIDPHTQEVLTLLGH